MPGILPVSNVAQTRRFAEMCGAAIPGWLNDLFEGLDELPAARQLIAATVAAELCGQLYAGGVRHFHFYTLNRAELSYAICHLLGVQGPLMSAAATLRAEAAKRILVKDGAYGTMIQDRRLASEDYCRGLDLIKDQRGNNDLLNLTQPSVGRGDLRAVRRRRRRHPRDQHLQRQCDQPGGLWRGSARGPDQYRRRAPDPSRRRPL